LKKEETVHKAPQGYGTSKGRNENNFRGVQEKCIRKMDVEMGDTYKTTGRKKMNLSLIPIPSSDKK